MEFMFGDFIIFLQISYIGPQMNSHHHPNNELRNHNCAKIDLKCPG